MENNMFTRMIDNIENNAAATIKANEGDYEVDGILYCGKCNTPKQVQVELFGSVRKPYCLCKCETEKRDREAEEFKRNQQMIEIEKMRSTQDYSQDVDSENFALFKTDDDLVVDSEVLEKTLNVSLTISEE